MDVIFEGRLSNRLTIKEILQRIASQGAPGVRILRISGMEPEHGGRIVISQDRYVTAAGLSQSTEIGYSALRKLLGITEGNFAYLNTGKHDFIDLEPNLNIELYRLIDTMPHLPESAAQLFDERSLLDKIFGSPDDFPEVKSSEVPVLADTATRVPQQQQSQPQSSMPGRVTGDQTWNLLQPLLQEQSHPPGSLEITREFREKLDEARAAEEEVAAARKTTQSATAQKAPQKIRANPWQILILLSIVFVVELLLIAFWEPLNTMLEPKTSAVEISTPEGTR